ncbi:hypothetical protein [Microbacterium saperdae]|uniref:Uncharacterized protein n=1 Tax=Microbacterium saperdae TaxID=69368 RepID=A0A543BID9_9MICO|nr:hypothetical protein [Microbacterium saperdae]TQL84586.1 hypothetical protein FB560_0173 [Microbacterium saperdae]GGM61553.1 hypothetical protein GCM10010489_36280 [Microbacterium saperdae]
MLAILKTAGHVLWRHWPALMAWYLAGVLVHYAITQIAGTIGASSATLGFLVLPLAILARLVSLVAMFLVLRDGLRNLQEVAPLPESAVDRRRTFLSALLTGILPFFAVYWAQGLLGEDVRAYSSRALAVRSSITAVAGFNGEPPISDQDTVLNLPLNGWTVAIIVLAFAGRWAWSKWSSKLASWLSPVAVYFEVVWVFFSVLLLGDIFDAIKAWVDSRAAMAFLETVREQILDAIAPLRWLWDGIGWVLSEAGPVLIAPLAWLTIAGVVFGQAIVAEKLRVESELVARIREHAAVIPNPLVRRLKDLGDELGARFRPIGRALLLMWRAGPLLVASYALLYVIVKAAESFLAFGVTRLVGPHDYFFWAIATPLVSLVPLLLMEPVRIAVISGAYDATLGRLRRKQQERTEDAGLSPAEAEVRAVADAAGLLPSSVDAVAAAVVSAPARDVVGGQRSSENLTKDPPAL